MRLIVLSWRHEYHKEPSDKPLQSSCLCLRTVPVCPDFPVGPLLSQGSTGCQVTGSGEPTRCLQAADRFEEAPAATIYCKFSPLMGHNLKVVGQVGRPCSSYATSYSKEMAYHCFPVLLAMEVSSEGWSASDFQGDAGPDLEAK